MHSGYAASNYFDLSPTDCCRKCYATNDCDYILSDGARLCFVVTVGSAGSPGVAKSGLCPAGFDFRTAFKGRGDGPPKLVDNRLQLTTGPCFAGATFP